MLLVRAYRGGHDHVCPFPLLLAKKEIDTDSKQSRSSDSSKIRLVAPY